MRSSSGADNYDLKICFVKEFSHVDMSDNSDGTLSCVYRPRRSLF